jgi:ubiquitin-protein ligase
MSNVRLRRLQADYEKLRAFLGRQPRIRLIQAQGSPPERYQLEFQIRGLREVDDQLQAVANHIVEIALPLSYPRLPPQCRMLTPVFHPNIAPHAICIGDHWNAGEPLWSMVARIGEMIAYQSYNTKSPLNGEAARWVESNPDKVPLDKTNFMLDDVQPSEEAADPSLIPLAGERVPPPRPASPPHRPATSLAASPAQSVSSSPPMAIPLPSRPRPATSDPSSPPMAKPLPASPRPAPIASLNPEPPAFGAAGSAPAAAAAAPPEQKLIIQCGQCGARYSVPPAAAGKKVRCKKCQGILVIPAMPPQP